MKDLKNLDISIDEMVLKSRLKQINSSSLEWLPMTDENSKLVAFYLRTLG